MKYLSDYTEQAYKEAFKKHGAFWAFGQKQFDEAKTEGVIYVSLGHGCICPKENASQLNKDLDEAFKSAIKQDIEENGIEAIIVRELYNHEAFYVYSIEDTIDCLKYYPITEDQIKKAFYKELANIKAREEKEENERQDWKKRSRKAARALKEQSTTIYN